MAKCSRAPSNGSPLTSSSAATAVQSFSVAGRNAKLLLSMIWLRSLLPRQGLERTDEATDELAIDLTRELPNILTLPGEKVPRIFDAVDTGDFNVCFFEADASEFCQVVLIRQRACHAAHPEFHALTDCGWHLPTHDDV